MFAETTANLSGKDNIRIIESFEQKKQQYPSLVKHKVNGIQQNSS